MRLIFNVNILHVPSFLQFCFSFHKLGEVGHMPSFLPPPNPLLTPNLLLCIFVVFNYKNLFLSSILLTISKTDMMVAVPCSHYAAVTSTGTSKHSSGFCQLAPISGDAYLGGMVTNIFVTVHLIIFCWSADGPFPAYDVLPLI
jgi:hypothetical protein